MVYKVGDVARTALRRSTSLLQSVEIELLGIILNGIRADLSTDYQDLGYSAYYAYGTDADTPARNRGQRTRDWLTRWWRRLLPGGDAAEGEGAPAVAVEASQAEEDTGRPHVSRAARLAAYGALLATALGLVWQSGYLDRPLGLIPALGGRLSGEWEESRPPMDEEWVPDRGPVESGTAVPEPGTEKGAALVDAAAAPVARNASEGLVAGPSPSAPAAAMSATELATAPPPAPEPGGLPEPDAGPAPAAPPIVTVSRAFAVRVASYPPGSRWAERSLNRLRQAGERAFFSPVHSRGQVYDRLLVGRFVSWDEAYRYARGLQDEGVVEEFSVQRLPFSLDLGRYPTRVAALEAAAQGEGRYLHVLEVDGGFALRGGAFASIEEGDVLVGRLTGAEPLSADNN